MAESIVPELTAVRSVLLVAPAMSPRGTSEYTLNLAREFRRTGVEVAVACAPGPMLPRVRGEDIPVRIFDHLERIHFRFGEQRALLQAVENYDPQLVHAQSLRVAGAMRPLSRRTRLPLLLTVHWRPRRARAFRRFSRRLNGIIATTQAVREEVVNQCGVERSKIKVIRNGIELHGSESAPIPPIFRSQVPVVGSLGPVEEMRGHELFVRAAAVLAGGGAEAQFVVAGQGGELPELRKLIAELGLERLMTVASDFSSYTEVLAAMDVVVQSSQVDISGFSILEAMGRERPVVAFNTGTACELVEDGRTGLIVPKGEVQALADAIRRLIADPDEARSMARRAREAVHERHNIRTIARQTLDYYAQILSE